MNPEEINRFWNKVNKTDGCWLWTACKDPNGYGRFSRPVGQSNLAHRISYELCIGTIPKDKVLDHLCRNTSCVNPEHLEAVIHRENIIRGNTVKPYCKNGHLLEGDNLQPMKRAGRRCKPCNRMYSSRSLNKNRKAVNIRRKERRRLAQQP